MQIFSQRDPKWKNEKMGTGTIGAFGCTISCIGMLSDITPSVINNEIKNVNGYQGNLVIWDKLDLIKGFDFIKRVKVYSNSDVLSNLPCLVEVNGAPIGGTTHWVLYIGNHRLYDPWDGKEKATSAYQAIGYAVIKYSSPYLAPQISISPSISESPSVSASPSEAPVVVPEPPQPTVTQEVVTTTTFQTPEVVVSPTPTSFHDLLVAFLNWVKGFKRINGKN